MSFASTMKLALHCQGRQQLNKRILPCLGRRQGYFSSRKIISSSSNTSHWLAKDNSRVAAKRNYHSSPPSEPGSLAFAAGELAAVSDLFFRYANTSDGGIDQDGSSFLTPSGVRKMLSSIGENPDDATFEKLFHAADLNGDGKLQLHEFLLAADKVLGDNPSNIVLVVGGPGSGKGALCARLAEECNCVHMSSGKLLREEVERGTPLGRQVADSIARGELISSSVITALIRRNMRKFPGRRVLLDGFPRSLENAIDFSHQMGKPELALHLVCDDTVMMERILKRSRENPGRADDNIDTALSRLRTYHRSHGLTLEWLKDNHVPVINLDCSGTQQSVWNQLQSIGRLMRPSLIKDQELAALAHQQVTQEIPESKVL